jgi:hypothetical protein
MNELNTFEYLILLFSFLVDLCISQHSPRERGEEEEVVHLRYGGRRISQNGDHVHDRCLHHPDAEDFLFLDIYISVRLH